ncbi:hypothetical protein [Nostoc sp.]|uniref:hypothetical protein n=1 Tax=Nostoc sp. TaxID=1180 RepID=UPI002FF768A0
MKTVVLYEQKNSHPPAASGNIARSGAAKKSLSQVGQRCTHKSEKLHPPKICDEAALLVGFPGAGDCC